MASISDNKVRKTLSLNKTTEKDIPLIERVESVTNFNDYIKRLIEKDIRQRRVIKVENKPVQTLSVGGEINVNGLALLS